MKYLSVAEEYSTLSGRRYLGLLYSFYRILPLMGFAAAQAGVFRTAFLKRNARIPLKLS